MNKTRRATWLLSGIAFAVVLAIGLGLSWQAGAPEEIRQISVPVAVPDLPR